MNKGLLIVGIVIVLLLAAGYAFYLFPRAQDTSGPSTVGEQPVATSGDVKTFVITGSHLRFFMNGVESPELHVKEGDHVRIEFTSTEGTHDWKVDEFNAATAKVGPRTPSSVEFVTNKKGTFEYYCSVGQHRQNGMRGNLIVE